MVAIISRTPRPSSYFWLRRIIARKNEAQYGGTFWSRQAAEVYLEQVRRFTAWAMRVLAER